MASNSAAHSEFTYAFGLLKKREFVPSATVPLIQQSLFFEGKKKISRIHFAKWIDLYQMIKWGQTEDRVFKSYAGFMDKSVVHQTTIFQGRSAFQFAISVAPYF